MKKPFSLILFFMLLCGSISAQQVELNFQNTPLNEVLIDLAKRENIQVSIGSNESNNCLINIHKTFLTIDAAIKELASGCSLEVKKIGKTYTFRKSNEIEKEANPIASVKYLFQGIVIDPISNEPLPFTMVQTPEKTLVSDENGQFSFFSKERKLQLRILQLGYLVLDTLIDNGRYLKLGLSYDVRLMESIIIFPEAKIAYNSSEAGRVKLNDVNSRLVPGNRSNLLFNSIRLQPGVTASGESVSNFLLWGSYPGQNNVIYDGITLYSSAGINDDIGRVNPLMIKNIEVFKGGYNVGIGDRAGGVVKIDGKQGNIDSLNGEFVVNQQIATGYLSIPLKKVNSTIQLGGRQSYYGLIQPIKPLQYADYAEPNYTYGDFNLKLTSVFKNGDRFQMTHLTGKDIYTDSLSTQKEVGLYDRVQSINTNQSGTSAVLDKLWNSGGISTISISYSQMESKTYTLASYSDTSGLVFQHESQISNAINETSIRLKHKPSSKGRHEVLIGVGIINNKSQFNLESGALSYINDHGLSRLELLAKDNIHISNRINLQFGLKVDAPMLTLQPYIQPRINGGWRFHENWKFNFGWGIYNQFATQSALLDKEGIRTYVWNILNNDQKPQALHNIGGVTYQKGNLEITAEGYYKTTQNMHLFKAQADTLLSNSFAASVYGVDLLVKKKWNNMEILLAYSLNKVTETHADSVGIEKPIAAPQSQTHEIKTGLNYWKSRFKFSVNHVYGSGFIGYSELLDNKIEAYSRLDAAVEYRLIEKKIVMDFALSVLNVMNRKNLLFNPPATFSDGTSAYALATPFTPTFNIRIGF
ncbi:MAG: TonB-dependent receptor [Flavobacteriales bacterium]|nr:TonB-dependent receptor [Flavobacteriales bacterium]